MAKIKETETSKFIYYYLNSKNAYLFDIFIQI